MPWVEVFLVFVVSHLAGDFLLQTEWQARHKSRGLAGGEAARALLTHVFSYTLAFVSALVWLGADIGWDVAWVVALIAVPHLIQDDGRLLLGYLRRVKHSDAEIGSLVFVMADQSFHVITLFAVALMV